MRKRAITSFILINAISFIVSGISNLKCDTLFQLKPNESVYKLCETNDSIIILNLDLWDDRTFYYTITSSNEFRYACIVTNSRDKSATLVWNGERKVFSDDYNSLQTCKTTLDFIDFSKCSYIYERNNEQFLVIEGIEYGPYESVDYTPPFEYSHTYINRKYFNFTQMGSEFIHYNDGTILPANIPRKEYCSINGLHKVIFSDDWSTITLDGKIIELEMKYHIKKCYNVCLLNNGTCIFDIDYFETYNDSFRPYRFILASQRTEAISFPSTYNFKTNYRSSLNASVVPLDSDDPENKPFYGTLLQDYTKTHTFISKEGYDYVLIDGKKYGKRAPLEAFYVEQTNSFMWVAEEDGCLVLYTYILD